MIPEDRRQAQVRTRGPEKGGTTLEQLSVLLAGVVALAGFLLI